MKEYYIYMHIHIHIYTYIYIHLYTVRHGEVAMTVGECLVTLHSQTGSRKNTGSWAGYKTWPTFSSKAPPPKSSTVFQNIAVSWGPSTQIQTHFILQSQQEVNFETSKCLDYPRHHVKPLAYTTLFSQWSGSHDCCHCSDIEVEGCRSLFICYLQKKMNWMGVAFGWWCGNLVHWNSPGIEVS